MRIAMIAPLEIRVPPVAFGGTELVVSLLTEELVRRGHDVTLFASGDSVTAARLVSGCPRSLWGTDRVSDILNLLNVVTCLRQQDQFDIIHNHNDRAGLALAGLVKTPVLTTIHYNYIGDQLLLFADYQGWYNTISLSAKSLLPAKERSAGVIYNPIDVDSYPFNGGEREPHLLFLSRMCQEKGPHLAIEVAKRLGRRLILAGNCWDSAHEEYFRTQVLPEVDGEQIQYVGEADYFQKRELMSNAYCLLAPITWSEPFGLFMAEAMACGTPVVAFNRGAAPEVVSNGETGFVVENLDEMTEAVQKIHEVDPIRCREHVRRNFDVAPVVDDYLAAYELVISSSQRQPLAFSLAKGS